MQAPLPDHDTLAADYRRDGYAVVPDVLDADDITALVAETAQIARGNRGPVRGLVPVPDEIDDEAALARYLTVQFPHKASELIRDRFLAHPRFLPLLTAVVGPNVKCMQSMLFMKPSGKPGQAWHQDEHFIPTRDRSLVGLWLAIDDATEENGCIWVRPGSHADGILYPMAPHGSPDFDSGDQLTGTTDDTDPGIPVPVRSGSVLLFNGYLHHRSLPNRAPAGTFRRALVNHYMSAESMLPWHWDGRLAPSEDMRDVVLVAGVDPYGWKGTEDLTYAFLRAETRDADDPLFDPDKQVY
ncbi:MAG: phytanoyl-CoA dioxygenase family protein [Actinomycetota bacterium]